MMEKTKVGAKMKGWPLASSLFKPKEGVINLAHKEEVIVAKGSSIYRKCYNQLSPLML
jgi:hypothetical protein